MTIINMTGGPAPKPIVVEAVEETPSTLPHTFVPREGVDYLSSVTVGKDPNLVPENVKKDVTIFGVEGSLSTSGTDFSTLDPFTVKGHNSFGALWPDDESVVSMTEETGTAQVYYNPGGWGIAGAVGNILFQGFNGQLTTYAFPYTKVYTISTTFTGTITTGGSVLEWNAGDEIEGWILPLALTSYTGNLMAPETEDVYVKFHATFNETNHGTITLERPVKYVANDSWTSTVANNIRMRPVIMYKVN